MGFSEKHLTVAVLFTSFLFIAYYSITQDIVLYQGGAPYDATFYAELTAQFAAGQELATRAPFAYRIALPLLVSVTFPDEIIRGFHIWNFIFSGINLLLLYLLLMQFTRSHLKASVLLLLFIWNPISSFRLGHFYPVFVDPPAFTAILLILYWGVKHPIPSWRDSLVLSAACFTGVLAREVVIVPAIAIFCQQLVFAWRNRGVFAAAELKGVCTTAVPVLLGFAAIVLSHTLPETTGGYSFESHVIRVSARNIYNPEILVLATLTAFGLILSIPLAEPGRSLVFLRSYPLITFYIAGMGMLSASAGFHTERLLHWAYPGVFALVLSVWERQESAVSRHWNILFYLLLIIGSIFMFRAFLPIPNADYDFLFSKSPAPDTYLLAPYGPQIDFGNTSAGYMDRASRWILLAQILPYLAFMIFVYRKANSCKTAPRGGKTG